MGGQNQSLLRTLEESEAEGLALRKRLADTARDMEAQWHDLRETKAALEVCCCSAPGLWVLGCLGAWVAMRAY